MTVKVIKTIDEFREAINTDTPAVFDFWATWCGPCKVISPVFQQLSEKFPNINFYKVDVDEAQDIAQEVGVRAVSVFILPIGDALSGRLTIVGFYQMPTFMAFKNGNKIKDLVGANAPALQNLIASLA
ncbi:hypothetical protein BN946_scf184615.g8 [Trametes cinnabarina]|uniref:Thioredoxin n=1 Tax=Pycnoporus cinnabarinus TaxID=5643 RepID=A0A060SPK6_PYCCI|nr:hypothetical protein BN946_scf184615.g8 [Trametes cinnabarina]